MTTSMTQSFSAQVHEIVLRNSALMEVIAKESTQRLIHIAQTPKTKGGKMPLDTGFLRASGRLSLTGMPTGPTRGEKAAGRRAKGRGKKAKAANAARQTYSAPDSLTITGFALGMSLFFGWTAVYARRQNLYSGFLDSAIRQWQKIVDDVVRDVRGRMK